MSSYYLIFFAETPLISKKTAFVLISSFSLNHLQFQLHHFPLQKKSRIMKLVRKFCYDLRLFKISISIIPTTFAHPHVRQSLMDLVTESQFSSPSFPHSFFYEPVSLPSPPSGLCFTSPQL